MGRGSGWLRSATCPAILSARLDDSALQGFLALIRLVPVVVLLDWHQPPSLRAAAAFPDCFPPSPATPPAVLLCSAPKWRPRMGMQLRLAPHNQHPPSWQRLSTSTSPAQAQPFSCCAGQRWA